MERMTRRMLCAVFAAEVQQTIDQLPETTEAPRPNP